MRSTAREESTRDEHAGAAFAYEVHDALRHLHDIAYLQTHALTRRIDDPGPATPRGSRGRALQGALLDAIDALRPGPELAADSRTWRTYRLLTLRFAAALDPAEVRSKLAISRSEYFREQRRALDAVSFALREHWGLLDEAEDLQAARPASIGFVSGTPGQAGGDEMFTLPSPPGLFVGRRQELAEVQARLTAHRLVTLTGAPGTGKTRLALEAAGRMRAAFLGGIFFLDLTPLSDPELVMPAIARLLHVRGAAVESAIQVLQEALQDGATLIILDNFEHLLTAAPALVQLLDACPSLHILATSRARLRISGESELPVAPLPVPDANPLIRPSAFEHTAGALFVARAQEARPTFILTDDDAPDVVEICARLDGLPLAIELAAARVRYLALKQLLARLPNRLALLVGGVRDRPLRQQTLRDAITWSYELLSSDQQKVFRRLAVFSSGWTLEAAEAILDGIPGQEPAHSGTDLFDSLVALVDNSLVREQGEAEGGPRFDMLGTIRDFAVECLAASSEASLLRERHAAYYAALATQRAALSTDVVDMLEREHDNMRAALDWFSERGDADAALRLAIGLCGFWRRRGFYTEGRARLAAALAIPGGHLPTGMRALALRRQASIAMEMGDYSASREYIEQALRLYRALGDESGVAHAFQRFARLAIAEGNDSEARELGERSVAILRAVGEREGTGTALLALARATMLHPEELSAARMLLEEAVDLFQESRGSRWLALALCLLGEVGSAQGNYSEARHWFAESLVLLEHVRDSAATAEALAGLAGVAAAQASAVQALHLAGAADTIRDRIGAPRSTAWRRELERRLAPAERALDPAAREAAWRVGRELSTQGAIALAIEYATAPH